MVANLCKVLNCVLDCGPHGEYVDMRHSISTWWIVGVCVSQPFGIGRCMNGRTAHSECNKYLLGGKKLQVEVKHQKKKWLRRIPVMISSNTPIGALVSGGEYDIVAMNEWKKKCVGLQRTWVSKRTVNDLFYEVQHSPSFIRSSKNLRWRGECWVYCYTRVIDVFAFRHLFTIRPFGKD